MHFVAGTNQVEVDAMRATLERSEKAEEAQKISTNLG